jgi:dihydroorotase
MYDLVIEGGLLAIATELVPGDLAVAGGTIAAIARHGSALPTRQRIDAGGLLVLPGLVDAHVHCRQPGLEHKEDFASASRAAVAGGVTTMMVMPTDNPFTDTAERLSDKRAMVESSSLVDVALQAAVGREPGDLSALAAAGAISFEAFLSDVPEAYLVPDDGMLLEIMQAVKKTGGVLGITPGTPAISGPLEAHLRAQGKLDPAAFIHSRPTVAEALAVARICLLARSTGARVHIRQVSCADSVDVLAGMKAGAAITAEVTAHNLCLDENRFAALGPFAKVVPPLRPSSDVSAVQKALLDQLIDIVVTDHAPHAPAEKEAGVLDIWQAPGGFPGLQTLLPALLHLVEIDQASIPSIVGWAATNPARIFGLSPRKGSLRPGADADIILIDPNSRFIVRNEDQFSKARRTPFEGLDVKGRLVKTLSRGRTVFCDGAIVADGGGAVVSARRFPEGIGS